MKKLILAFSLLAVVALAGVAQDNPDIKIAVSVSPSKVIVDRSPAAAKLARPQAVFALTVSNTGKSDFTKTLTPGQVFEFEVFDTKKPDVSLWKWSTAALAGGAKFAASTKLTVKAGDTVTERKIWSFDATKVPDGTYKVVATFLATGAKVEQEFTVHSGIGE